MQAPTRHVTLILSVFALIGCEATAPPHMPSSTADVHSETDVADVAPAPRTIITAEEGPFVLQPYCHDTRCAANENESPDPSAWGPYPVGVRTITLESVGYEGDSRSLTVEVWYPATEAHRDGPFETIDVVNMAPPHYAEEANQYAGMAGVPTLAVRNADALQDQGPYPLVIFSHGAYGLRVQSVFFTVFLASHGYVVASPDHEDNTMWDMLFVGYDPVNVGLNAFDRPLDIQALLDELLHLNATPDTPLAALIDPTRVGMSGHSFGGYTSFRLAFSDPRFKAIVPMTPATSPLGFEFLEVKDLSIPTMIMAGDLDVTLDTQTEMKDAYDEMPGPQKYYVSLAEGGHYTFSDICEIDMLTIAQVAGIGEAEDLLNDGCGPTNIETAIAHPIIRQFAIGFLNQQLRGSDVSNLWFDATAAAEWGDALIYEAQP
jgi:predicted dienelactone hydrolase